MLRFSNAQIEAARVGSLQALWQHRATREGLSQKRSAELENDIVNWIIQHSIERPENVDFIMIASARSDGAFLEADPIKAAMDHARGEYEIVISAIRREAAMQIQSGAA
ncbi:hypothetical protein So717_14950 [Roseobacter cerasinus]|uniref:Uncharacterized protein n=1 Tax=Roseobacter cerasinus TaxID=2602289 RepID=A0A640VPY1_9RHOB|nr:hypothetical protein [Roseobacter cerasinus]GFE49742.1 hypothetical protein So717_14950 [Roseobacter cerasinus]